MLKFCHGTKTGHLIAIAFEKPKSKDSWSNIFYLNLYVNWPKHCKDKCAILKLWWNLPQYANGFKSHSRLKQKTNLTLHQFLTKGCKSLCWWGWSLMSLCIMSLTQLHMVSSSNCPCPPRYSKSNHVSVLAFQKAMVKIKLHSQLIQSMAHGTFLGNHLGDFKFLSFDLSKKLFILCPFYRILSRLKALKCLSLESYQVSW